MVTMQTYIPLEAVVVLGMSISLLGSKFGRTKPENLPDSNSS